ncbi:MAG TPA: glutathione S-transferase family protein [Gaiellales bacterium]|nr:glutathione S-transferase family protein [Gaiellales bacterium]
MRPTLYSGAPSSNALKVRFLLAHLELDHDLVEVPMQRPRPDWYLAFQPSGTVPALRDGDLVIGESNAVLRYLAARERRDDLYPADPAARSQVEWALDLWSMLVRPGLRRLEVAALFSDPIDPAAVEAEQPRAERVLAVYERFAADGDTVLDQLSLADFCVAPVLWRSLRLPIDFTPYPRLARLRETLPALPAFAAASPVS